MKVLSVRDPEFAEYGRVFDDVDPALTGAIVEALAHGTPVPEATDYVAEEPALQGLPAASALAPLLFGGSPV